MDAVEYLKTLRRLCESQSGCAGCVLLDEDDSCFATVNRDGYVEKAVTAVEQWAKEHPVKTRQSEFLEQFPGASVSDGTLDIRPCIIEKTVKCIALEGKDCDNCRREYWLEEVTGND